MPAHQHSPDMEQSIGVLRIPGEGLDRLVCRPDNQVDFSPACFALNLVHYRKRPIFSCSNYQTFAIPRQLLFNRYRGMSELLTELFRSFLLALEDLATINHHIMA